MRVKRQPDTLDDVHSESQDESLFASSGSETKQVVGLDVWSYSEEHQLYTEARRMAMWRAVAGAVLLVVAGMFLAGTNWAQWSTFPEAVDGGAGWLILPIVTCGTLGLAALTYSTWPYFTARRAFRERQRASAATGVEVAMRRLAASTTDESLPLPELFVLNRRQLDEYQTITKRQQSMAFSLTWIATSLAFIVLISGIVLSYRSGTGTGQYVVGGLTGLGSLVSGYLSQTFYRGYGEATRQLQVYYAEPNLTGRALAAERLMRGITNPAERTRTARDIVTVLLTPAQTAVGNDPVEVSDIQPETGA